MAIACNGCLQLALYMCDKSIFSSPIKIQSFDNYSTVLERFGANPQAFEEKHTSNTHDSCLFAVLKIRMNDRKNQEINFCHISTVVFSLKVAEHSFQVPMLNSPLLLNHL